MKLYTIQKLIDDNHDGKKSDFAKAHGVKPPRVHPMLKNENLAVLEIDGEPWIIEFKRRVYK